MKFLTLNCHSWLEENQTEKLDQLVKNIAANDYDVICLQEVNQLVKSEVAVLDDWFIPSSTDVVIHEDNFALRLQEQLQCVEKDYYWSWCYNHIGYDRFHEGVAILAKTPFIAKDHLVSKTTDVADYHTRRILTALTEVDGQLLQVVSGHFSWWPKGFSAEWEKTEAFLATNSYPLVLMGDFNNPAHTPGYELILASDWQLQDSFYAAKKSVGNYTTLAKIAGWEESNGERIDYIFMTPEFKVVTHEVIFDGGKTPIVSDHFGVSVTAQWQ